MYIAVCDDNSIDREIIIMMLRDYAAQKSIHLDITEYRSGINLIYDIEEGARCDIIFLDIYMDEILGIEVAHKLRKEIHYEGSIIFLSATSKFAVDSYEVDASGYLVKPLTYEKLFTVMDKILSTHKTRTYQIRKHSNFIHIPIDEILYIDSNNNKCTLHRKGSQNYIIYKRLDEIQKELPASHFLRCHQSYLVNMDYISRADKEFVLVTGDIISIRQRDLKNIRSVYLNYVSQQEK